jgi:hypothetical protein
MNVIFDVLAWQSEAIGPEASKDLVARGLMPLRIGIFAKHVFGDGS